MPSGARLRAAAAVLLAALAAACAYRLEPPSRVADPATAYILDYGQHAGLALPAPDGGVVEWFWGDWHYFALGRRSVGSGLRALFASPGSTLGYRPLAGPEAAGAPAVLPIVVERARVDALHARLAARHARRREAEVVDGDGRRFVPDDARYGLGHNSSHMLAEWLRELGVEVRGGGLDARFEVRSSPAGGGP